MQGFRKKKNWKREDWAGRYLRCIIFLKHSINMS